MTRRISLTIGIAVVALAVGVPTAFGKGQQPSAVGYFKANELSTLVQSGKASAVDVFRANELSTLVQSGESAPVGYRDAHERGEVTTPVQSNVVNYRDSFERTGIRGASLDPVATSSNVSTYRDAFERSNPQTAPATSSPAGSGTEIEWPQVGIGLALGVALMLGLLLAMRITRIRPLAH